MFLQGEISGAIYDDYTQPICIDRSRLDCSYQEDSKANHESYAFVWNLRLFMYCDPVDSILGIY